jgi:hypothetical protein
MAHSMGGLDDRHTLFNIRDSVSYSGFIFFADTIMLHTVTINHVH